MSSPQPRRWRLGLVLLALFGLLAAACGDDDDSGTSTDDGVSTTASAEPVTVRLGYFPNITHAPALVGRLRRALRGCRRGQRHRRDDHLQRRSRGRRGARSPVASTCVVHRSQPGHQRVRPVDGDAIRIVAGSTSGGAFLVVKDGIDAPEDLEGKTLATPQLGNTQDVALRAWLKDNGYETDEAGGGDVAIQPQANAEALAAFLAGDIDGAWVPEPWATRFIQEGGAHVLVDEADLWPDGRVRHHAPDRAHGLPRRPPRRGQGPHRGPRRRHRPHRERPRRRPRRLTNQGIEEITGKPLSAEVLDAAWEQPALHARSDRLLARNVGRGRRGGRPPRSGRARRASTTSPSSTRSSPIGARTRRQGL